MPKLSAKNQPIGTDHQIPFMPNCGTLDNIYAKATLVPKEKMVKITDIPGRLRAR